MKALGVLSAILVLESIGNLALTLAGPGGQKYGGGMEFTKDGELQMREEDSKTSTYKQHNEQHSKNSTSGTFGQNGTQEKNSSYDKTEDVEGKDTEERKRKLVLGPKEGMTMDETKNTSGTKTKTVDERKQESGKTQDHGQSGDTSYTQSSSYDTEEGHKKKEQDSYDKTEHTAWSMGQGGFEKKQHDSKGRKTHKASEDNFQRSQFQQQETRKQGGRTIRQIDQSSQYHSGEFIDQEGYGSTHDHGGYPSGNPQSSYRGQRYPGKSLYVNHHGHPQPVRHPPPEVSNRHPAYSHGYNSPPHSYPGSPEHDSYGSGPPLGGSRPIYDRGYHGPVTNGPDRSGHRPAPDYGYNHHAPNYGYSQPYYGPANYEYSQTEAHSEAHAEDRSSYQKYVKPAPFRKGSNVPESVEYSEANADPKRDYHTSQGRRFPAHSPSYTEVSKSSAHAESHADQSSHKSYQSTGEYSEPQISYAEDSYSNADAKSEAYSSSEVEYSDQTPKPTKPQPRTKVTHEKGNEKADKHLKDVLGDLDYRKLEDDTKYLTAGGRYVLVPGENSTTHKYYDTQTGKYFNIRHVKLSSDSNTVIIPGSPDDAGSESVAKKGFHLGYGIYYLGNKQYLYQRKVVTAEVMIKIVKTLKYNIVLTTDGRPLGLSHGNYPVDLGSNVFYLGNGWYRCEEKLISTKNVIEYIKKKKLNIVVSKEGFPTGILDGTLGSSYGPEDNRQVDLGHNLYLLPNSHYKFNDKIIACTQIVEFLKTVDFSIKLTDDGFPSDLLEIPAEDGYTPKNLGHGLCYLGKGYYRYLGNLIKTTDIIKYLTKLGIAKYYSIQENGIPKDTKEQPFPDEDNDASDDEDSPKDFGKGLHLGDDIYYKGKGEYEYRGKKYSATTIVKIIKYIRCNIYLAPDGRPLGHSHGTYPIDVGKDLYYIGYGYYRFGEKIITHDKIIEFLKTKGIKADITKDGYPKSIVDGTKGSKYGPDKNVPIHLGKGLYYLHSGHYLYRNTIITTRQIFEFVKTHNFELLLTVDGLPSDLFDGKVGTQSPKHLRYGVWYLGEGYYRHIGHVIRTSNIIKYLKNLGIYKYFSIKNDGYPTDTEGKSSPEDDDETKPEKDDKTDDGKSSPGDKDDLPFEVDDKIPDDHDTKLKTDEDKPKKDDKTPKKDDKSPKGDDKIPKKDDKSPKEDDKIPKKDDKSPKVDDRTPKKDDKSPKEDDKTPKKDDKSPKEDDKSPKKDDKSPKEDDKSPKKDDKSPKEDDKSPKKDDKSPKEDDKSPKKDDKSPKVDDRTPKKDDKSPKEDDKTPKKDDKSPKEDDKIPKKDDKSPKEDDKSPKKDDKSPKEDDKSPKKDDKSPKEDDKSPKKDDKSPKKDDKIPKKDDKSPKEDDKSPKKDDKSPKKDDKIPKKDDKSPKEDDKSPKKDDKSPKKDDKSPKKDDKSPKKDDKTPKKDDKSPKEDDKSPEKDDKTPKEDDKTPKKDDKSPKEDNKTPKKDDKSPKKDDKSTKEDDKSPKKDKDNSSPDDDGFITIEIDDKIPDKDDTIPKTDDDKAEKEDKSPKKDDNISKKDDKKPDKNDKNAKGNDKTPKKDDKTPKRDDKFPNKDDKSPNKDGKSPKNDKDKSSPEDDDNITPGKDDTEPKKDDQNPKNNNDAPEKDVPSDFGKGLHLGDNIYYLGNGIYEYQGRKYSSLIIIKIIKAKKSNIYLAPDGRPLGHSHGAYPINLGKNLWYIGYGYYRFGEKIISYDKIIQFLKTKGIKADITKDGYPKSIVDGTKGSKYGPDKNAPIHLGKGLYYLHSGHYQYSGKIISNSQILKFLKPRNFTLRFTRDGLPFPFFDGRLDKCAPKHLGYGVWYLGKGFYRHLGHVIWATDIIKYLKTLGIYKNFPIKNDGYPNDTKYENSTEDDDDKISVNDDTKPTKGDQKPNKDGKSPKKDDNGFPKDDDDKKPKKDDTKPNKDNKKPKQEGEKPGKGDKTPKQDDDSSPKDDDYKKPDKSGTKSNKDDKIPKNDDKKPEKDDQTPKNDKDKTSPDNDDKTTPGDDDKKPKEDDNDQYDDTAQKDNPGDYGKGLHLGNDIYYHGNGIYEYQGKKYSATVIVKIIKAKKSDVIITPDGRPLGHSHGAYPINLGNNIYYIGYGYYRFGEKIISYDKIIEFLKTKGIKADINKDGYPKCIVDGTKGSKYGPDKNAPIHLGKGLYYLHSGHYRYRNTIISTRQIFEFVKTRNINNLLTPDGLPSDLFEGKVGRRSPKHLGYGVWYLGEDYYRHQGYVIRANKIMKYLKKLGIYKNFSIKDDGRPDDTKYKNSSEDDDDKTPNNEDTKPTKDDKKPSTDDKTPKKDNSSSPEDNDDKRPGKSDTKPNKDDKKPKNDDGKPNKGDKTPNKDDNRSPKDDDDKKPGKSDTNPNKDDKKPKNEDEKPNKGDKTPKKDDNSSPKDNDDKRPGKSDTNPNKDDKKPKNDDKKPEKGDKTPNKDDNSSFKDEDDKKQKNDDKKPETDDQTPKNDKDKTYPDNDDKTTPGDDDKKPKEDDNDKYDDTAQKDNPGDYGKGLHLGNDIYYHGNGIYEYQGKKYSATVIVKIIKAKKSDVIITSDGRPLGHSHGAYPINLGNNIYYIGYGYYRFGEKIISYDKIIEFLKTKGIKADINKDGYPKCIVDGTKGSKYGPDKNAPIHLGKGLYYLHSGHYRYRNTIISTRQIFEFVKTRNMNHLLTPDGLPSDLFDGKVGRRSPKHLGYGVWYLGEDYYRHQGYVIRANKIMKYLKKLGIYKNFSIKDDGRPDDTKYKNSSEDDDDKTPNNEDTKPTKDDKKPSTDDKTTKKDDNGSTKYDDDKQSGKGGTKPKKDDKIPKNDDETPNKGDKTPKKDDNSSPKDDDDKKPGKSDTKPNKDDKKPKNDDGKPNKGDKTPNKDDNRSPKDDDDKKPGKSDTNSNKDDKKPKNEDEKPNKGDKTPKKDNNSSPKDNDDKRPGKSDTNPNKDDKKPKNDDKKPEKGDKTPNKDDNSSFKDEDDKKQKNDDKKPETDDQTPKNDKDKTYPDNDDKTTPGDDDKKPKEDDNDKYDDTAQKDNPGDYGKGLHLGNDIYYHGNGIYEYQGKKYSATVIVKIIKAKKSDVIITSDGRPLGHSHGAYPINLGNNIYYIGYGYYRFGEKIISYDKIIEFLKTKGIKADINKDGYPKCIVDGTKGSKYGPDKNAPIHLGKGLYYLHSGHYRYRNTIISTRQIFEFVKTRNINNLLTPDGHPSDLFDGKVGRRSPKHLGYGVWYLGEDYYRHQGYVIHANKIVKYLKKLGIYKNFSIKDDGRPDDTKYKNSPEDDDDKTPNNEDTKPTKDDKKPSTDDKTPKKDNSSSPEDDDDKNPGTDDKSPKKDDKQSSPKGDDDKARGKYDKKLGRADTKIDDKKPKDVDKKPKEDDKKPKEDDKNLKKDDKLDRKNGNQSSPGDDDETKSEKDVVKPNKDDKTPKKDNDKNTPKDDDEKKHIENDTKDEKTPTKDNPGDYGKGLHLGHGICYHGVGVYEYQSKKYSTANILKIIKTKKFIIYLAPDGRPLGHSHGVYPVDLGKDLYYIGYGYYRFGEKIITHDKIIEFLKTKGIKADIIKDGYPKSIVDGTKGSKYGPDKNAPIHLGMGLYYLQSGHYQYNGIILSTRQIFQFIKKYNIKCLLTKDGLPSVLFDGRVGKRSPKHLGYGVWYLGGDYYRHQGHVIPVTDIIKYLKKLGIIKFISIKENGYPDDTKHKNSPEDDTDKTPDNDDTTPEKDDKRPKIDTKSPKKDDKSLKTDKEKNTDDDDDEKQPDDDDKKPDDDDKRPGTTDDKQSKKDNKTPKKDGKGPKTNKDKTTPEDDGEKTPDDDDITPETIDDEQPEKDDKKPKKDGKRPKINKDKSTTEDDNDDDTNPNNASKKPKRDNKKPEKDSPSDDGKDSDDLEDEKEVQDIGHDIFYLGKSKNAYRYHHHIIPASKIGTLLEILKLNITLPTDADYPRQKPISKEDKGSGEKPESTSVNSSENSNTTNGDEIYCGHGIWYLGDNKYKYANHIIKAENIDELLKILKVDIPLPHKGKRGDSTPDEDCSDDLGYGIYDCGDKYYKFKNRKISKHHFSDIFKTLGLKNSPDKPYKITGAKDENKDHIIEQIEELLQKKKVDDSEDTESDRTTKSEDNSGDKNVSEDNGEDKRRRDRPGGPNKPVKGPDGDNNGKDDDSNPKENGNDKQKSDNPGGPKKPAGDDNDTIDNSSTTETKKSSEKTSTTETKSKTTEKQSKDTNKRENKQKKKSKSDLEKESPDKNVEDKKSDSNSESEKSIKKDDKESTKSKKDRSSRGKKSGNRKKSDSKESSKQKSKDTKSNSSTSKDLSSNTKSTSNSKESNSKPKETSKSKSYETSKDSNSSKSGSDSKTKDSSSNDAVKPKSNKPRRHKKKKKTKNASTSSSQSGVSSNTETKTKDSSKKTEERSESRYLSAKSTITREESDANGSTKTKSEQSASQNEDKKDFSSSEVKKNPDGSVTKKSSSSASEQEAARKSSSNEYEKVNADGETVEESSSSSAIQSSSYSSSSSDYETTIS